MSIWPTSQGETACFTSNQCVCQEQSQEVMRPDCAASVTPPSQQAAEHTSGQLICLGLRTDTHLAGCRWVFHSCLPRQRGLQSLLAHMPNVKSNIVTSTCTSRLSFARRLHHDSIN